MNRIKNNFFSLILKTTCYSAWCLLAPWHLGKLPVTRALLPREETCTRSPTICRVCSVLLKKDFEKNLVLADISTNGYHSRVCFTQGDSKHWVFDELNVRRREEVDHLLQFTVTEKLLHCLHCEGLHRRAVELTWIPPQETPVSAPPQTGLDAALRCQK